MKHLKLRSILLALCLCLLLSSCSFLFDSTEPEDTSSSGASPLSTFELLTDENMAIEGSGEDQYLHLTLHAGEEYQIRTSVDDLLGDSYYLTYTTDDDAEGRFTVTDTGTVRTNADLEENGVFVIDVELYKKGSSKCIESKHFIFSLLVGDYADITLTSDGLTYDASTSTYALALEAGSSLRLSYTVSYNTAYSISFSLVDPSHASFITVSNEGVITASEAGANQTAQIRIRLIGASGVLDTVYLTVTVRTNAAPANGLVLIDQATAQRVGDGDTLSVYQNGELSFDARYNGEQVTPTVTAHTPAILEADSTANMLKAVSVGSSEVTFAYGGEQITVTVTVMQDIPCALAAEGGGSAFIIVNGTLHYLEELYVTYESGAKVARSPAAVTATISDYNATHKTVLLKYTEAGTELSVSYHVRCYEAEAYHGISAAYDSNDLSNNSRYGTVEHLPSSGTVKLLVIPVWFRDSDVFFSESQKEQLVEDIEYTVNGDRPESELNSLKQYYEAQSYGAVTMDITVSDFYDSATSYKDYSDYEQDKLPNTKTLGTNAIQWYFATHTEEAFSDYDLNGDGYLDGVILYYAANYYGAVGDTNKTTAYELDTSSDSSEAFNTLVLCPIGGMYGLKDQDPAAQLAASDLSLTYARAFRSSARIVIHEVGHMFGNVDLYEDQLAEERYSPAGGFVMQDRNYGSHDPYHTNRLGWSKPQVYASSDYRIGDRITVHLKDFQSGGQNIILTNTWNPYDSLYDEYLIIELFAPIGLNGYDSRVTYLNAPKSGIRLWHVNATLSDLSEGDTTSRIVDGHIYELLNSNNDVTSTYDLLHLIRNNPEEAYHTGSLSVTDGALFGVGDSFDMETFRSQFPCGGTLDSGEKLGWAFTVEEIYKDTDGSYGAIITLERTDNVRTEFSQTVALNRSDLKTPDGQEEYGDDIFGADGPFTLTYQYVTPPSVYEQGYPISSDGMCLFASSDGNGGYIELAIKGIDGKEVRINSVSVVYSRLTNTTPTALVGGSAVEGTQFTPEHSGAYGVTYEVGATSVRIQNRYDGAVDHWSVLPLLEITVSYTIQ